MVELAGIGPAPYACMLLADAGADVIRLVRATPGGGAATGPHWDVLNRSRPSVGVDLKQPAAAALVLDLVERADALVEGFRPGVAERLGVGPEQCWARNPRLVYGRMTGWGQDGPLANSAGHDIDYIALSGALWSVGRARGATRCPRSTSSATSAGEGCCWPSASPPHWSRRGGPARARWWTRR